MTNNPNLSQMAPDPIRDDWVEILKLQHAAFFTAQRMCHEDPASAAAFLNISIGDACAFGSLSPTAVARLVELDNWLLEFPNSLTPDGEETTFFRFLIDTLHSEAITPLFVQVEVARRRAGSHTIPSRLG